MSLAAEMQWSLLPPASHRSPGVWVGAGLRPAYHVGGDAYDYSVTGRTLDLLILDAMGHGLHSAHTSALAVSSLRWARRRGLDLVAAARHADSVLHRVTQERSFVTALVVRVDLTKREVTWVNLGHPDAQVLRPDGTVQLAPSAPRSLPLGVRVGDEGPDPVVQHLTLAPGETLLLLTDGVLTARDRAGKSVDQSQLVAAAAGAAARLPRGANPAASVARAVTDAVVEHARGDLMDDATAVAVRLDDPV